MWLCRHKNNARLPKALHVHDNPVYYADIQRHQVMGWTMSRSQCAWPGLPHVSGDPGVRPPVVIDMVKRQ